MRRAPATAKLNLALVVGDVRDGGKHEVTTVLQRLALADRIGIEQASSLSVAGFEDDTLVRAALAALAEAAGVRPRWRAHIDKRIPVAAGLAGGSSDAATALRLANATLPEPLAVRAPTRDRERAGCGRAVLPHGRPTPRRGRRCRPDRARAAAGLLRAARASPRSAQAVDGRRLRGVRSPQRRRRRTRSDATRCSPRWRRSRARATSRRCRRTTSRRRRSRTSCARSAHSARTSAAPARSCTASSSTTRRPSPRADGCACVAEAG